MKFYRYKNKLSGPLLDRFDMFVEVNQVSCEELNPIQMKKNQKI